MSRVKARNELKYLISDQQYQILLKRLQQILPLDQNSKNAHGYLVRSLYFDSYNDRSFSETSEGFLLRKKYRLRIYDLETTQAKLEIKHKTNNQTRKETALISKETAIKISQGDYADLLKYDDEILNRIYAKFILGAYKPKALLQYQREAFFVDSLNIRVTFDRDICINNSNFDIFSKTLPTTPILDRDQKLLEIKFDQILPDYIKEILQINHFEKTGFSKYFIARKHEQLTDRSPCYY